MKQTTSLFLTALVLACIGVGMMAGRFALLLYLSPPEPYLIVIGLPILGVVCLSRDMQLFLTWRRLQKKAKQS